MYTLIFIKLEKVPPTTGFFLKKPDDRAPSFLHTKSTF